MIEFNKLSKREQKRQRKLDKKNEKYIHSESGSYSKKILKSLFRDFRIFVILVLLVFWKTGNEPVVLIGGVVGFLSVEVWQLARIKIKETDIEKESVEDDELPSC